jgi:hypothetical protein
MNEMNQHLDEGMIHAWLDGALSPDESARVEAHVNGCADCASLVAEARGLIAASSRILSSLDAVPSSVVPGSSAGVDQLAALRARRAAVSRTWWRDRRFIAAASLVLVAGVSSVVWRSTRDETVAARANATVDSVQPVPTGATSIAGAQVSPSEPSAREAAPGNAKAEAGRPMRDAAPVRVAARQAADSFADVKVASASVASGREAAVVGAVSQQAIDSTKALSRADQSAFERKVQQQVQTAPTPPRIIPEQQQADAQRAAAAPPSPSPLAARNRSTADAAAFGVGLRVAGTGPLAGGCYRLQLLAPNEVPRTVALADTVRLLDERVPERSDPAWWRARAIAQPLARTRVANGGPVTVEFRIRSARDTSLVRFHVSATGVAVPAPGALPPGVRAAMAVRVGCP